MSKKIRNSHQFEASSDETRIPYGQGVVMAARLRDALKRKGIAMTPAQWHARMRGNRVKQP